MEVRPAIPSDSLGIAAVNAAAWKTGFAGIAEAGFLETYDGLPDERLNDLLQPSPGTIQLVAVESDEVAGWVSAAPCEETDGDPETVFDLRACYVSPSRWRSGVGRRLVGELLEMLDRDRWQEIVVWTPARTPRSIGFYESFGFELDGGRKTFHRAGIEIVRLRLSL